MSGMDIVAFMTARTGITIDPSAFFDTVRTPGFRTDPYPFYAALREQLPVVRVESGGWLVTRYADVLTVLRDPALSTDPRRSGLHEKYASERTEGTLGEQAFSHFQFLDPPAHDRVRAEFAVPFGPGEIKALAPLVQRHTHRLLDEMARAGGTVDLVTVLAEPLPIAVILDVLGLPQADAADVAAWAQHLIANDDPDLLVAPERRVAAATAATEFGRYLARHAVSGAGRSGNGLLRTVLDAHRGGRLSLNDVLVNLMFVVVASLETSAGLIGNGVAALLDAPEARGRLARDPGLAAPAVEELLRLDSPIQYTPRFTVADYRIGETIVPAGSHLMAMVGAANHDPEIFTAPDTLDIFRRGRRHVGFGGGVHYCMGAALARMEGCTVFPALFARFPELRAAGAPQRREMFTLRSLSSLPVHLGQ